MRMVNLRVDISSVCSSVFGWVWRDTIILFFAI